jgi:hypothetical protein
MHDPEVTDALAHEVESMLAFTEWMSANIGSPQRHDEVSAAVHRITDAHRRVRDAYRAWSQQKGSKEELMAACAAFIDLVAVLAH